MRISEFEKNIIVDAVQNHDANAPVWLFGSRADDGKKGGDIDIAVLSHKISIKEKIKIKQVICDKIGEQHIDLFVTKDAADPFWGIAVEEGIQLNER
jgi:predicted nucleotidyltransferase